MRAPVTETLLASAIALAAGGGLERMWAHRNGVPPPAPPPPPPVVVVKELEPPHFLRTLHASSFLRGDIHAHSKRSDGDRPPEEVLAWYRAHGYRFVALTDHNLLSARSVAPETASGIVSIPGEEISMRVKGTQVHVNALCIDEVVSGGEFPTAKLALDHAISLTVSQEGVALVNHPNFDWALDRSDVLSAKGAALLEIASGHPYVHAAGDEKHFSHEALWDQALTAGMDVMGVAVDDMHHLVTDADPEAFPGTGWIEVFGDVAEEHAICDALRAGALYASTGGVVRSLEVTATDYAVTTTPGATVLFIGKGGGILDSTTAGAGPVSYPVKGNEGYVRVRIESKAGMAWTPAVRVRPAE